MKIKSADSKIILYFCHNCIPEGRKLPRQWNSKGVPIQVKEIPCSGKIDIQYLFHALEEGARGICVFTCPMGACTLSQGNYRAKIRLRTVSNLLKEIGIQTDRANLIHVSPQESYDGLKKIIDNEINKFLDLEPNPMTA